MDALHIYNERKSEEVNKFYKDICLHKCDTCIHKGWEEITSGGLTADVCHALNRRFNYDTPKHLITDSTNCPLYERKTFIKLITKSQDTITILIALPVFIVMLIIIFSSH